VEAQAYKFVSNEYRFFPVTVKVNACKEYSRDSLGLKEMLTKSSTINPCSMK
ncbi:hypothetical protein ILUMI_13579, partial [Ignelater luminosus]